MANDNRRKQGHKAGEPQETKAGSTKEDARKDNDKNPRSDPPEDKDSMPKWRNRLIELAIAIVGAFVVDQVLHPLPFVIENIALVVGIAFALVVGALLMIRAVVRGSLRELWFYGILPFSVFVACILILIARPLSTAGIRITTIPPVGAGPFGMDDIGGSVMGLDTLPPYTNYGVAIYAYTKNPPGRDPWFVEPDLSQTLTPIGDDGSWSNHIYHGSKYAAILVKQSYKPPATLPVLPVISGDIVAVTTVEGTRPK